MCPSSSNLTRTIDGARAAFLAGEGTLTVHDVLTWAEELGAGTLRMPGQLAPHDELMVAVAGDVTNDELLAVYGSPDESTGTQEAKS